MSDFISKCNKGQIVFIPEKALKKKLKYVHE